MRLLYNRHIKEKFWVYDLVEVISDDLPDSGPLQSDTTHVVIGNLHDFC